MTAPGRWSFGTRSERRWLPPPLRSGFTLHPSFVTLSAVSEVITILDRVQQGDAQAADELLPIVNDELRKLASAKMANEAAGHTL